MYAPHTRAPSARDGFTLVEVLVATVLVLIMLATVVSVFANMSDSMSDSRSMIEVNDRLRYTKDRLQLDLAGVTVPMLPPRRPESGEGYFEYIEGPIGPILPPPQFDSNRDGVINTLDDIDSTVGDNDDILMFTTRSSGEPFVGRFKTIRGSTTTIQSQVAEVCWFLRGTTLYRRQLLVAPAMETVLDAGNDPGASAPPRNWRTDQEFNFYANCDLSVRQEGGTHDWRSGGTAAVGLQLNTLGDLTKRENRYGHQPWAYPHDARFWGALGLPTLRECSDPRWPFPLTNTLVSGAIADNSPLYAAALRQNYIVPSDGTTALPMGSLVDDASANPRVLTLTGTVDSWRNPYPWSQTDQTTGTLDGYGNGGRIADDVILTNVLSFDVKAWDPGAPIFQDPATLELISPSGMFPEQNVYKLNATKTAPQPFFDQASDFNTLGTGRPVAYGDYVDLNYLGGLGPDFQYPPTNYPANFPQSHFFGLGRSPLGDPNSFLRYRLAGYPSDASIAVPTNAAPAVYDTWSTHYEHDGFNQDGDTVAGAPLVDEGTNGFDDDGIGGVDDELEKEAPPPYPVPLRGIQVKIRVFEPGTRQIREVTVVQDFVAQ